MKGLEHVNVLVQRGTNVSIPVLVPTYEVPVLQAIHDLNDESPMVFVQGAPVVVEVEDFDAAVALDALKRKYQQNLDALQHVYKNANELNRAVRLVETAPRRGRPPKGEEQLAA